MINSKITKVLGSLSITVAISTTTPLFGQQAIPGKYIVVVNPRSDAAGVAAAHGVQLEHIYTAALNGFAGIVPPGRLNALLRDRRVELIEPDVIVSLVAGVKRQSSMGRTATTVASEIIPTGVARVNAHLNPRLNVSAAGVAVIDTGISLAHADLNVAGSVSFVRGVRSANDDNGHGSHVAGIIGAKVNGIGVRGVAPNTRLFAVKVLDSTGNGTLSAVISGIDWVTRYGKSKGIKVANMSLGFQGTSASLNSAISKSVDAGISYVVAAGNSAADASFFSPANHPRVITVSAIAETDGRCGGMGPASAYGWDDSFASFSNFGLPVEIAAPGVNIYSTFRDGGYATLSGTSMAAPHVAGAAAQVVASNPSATSDVVRAAILSAAVPQAAAACGEIAPGIFAGGFSGDPDNFSEPLLDSSNL